jgi:putative lipoic acid-binding regulatory protein
MTNPSDSILSFPCDFAIKIFGIHSDEFEIHAINLVRNHTPNLTETAISSRPSKDGKYLALTITVHVESKQQLDNIYQDLTASPHILMAL